MPVFAVLATKDDPSLNDRIREKFPKNYYRIAPGQWLIDANETVKYVSEELGLGAEGGISGGVVVFKIDSYYGYHDNDLWEWLQLPRSNGD